MAVMRSTKAQTKKLMDAPVGTGFIIWKSSETTTTEVEFVIKDGQLINYYNGRPVSFEYGKMGLIKSTAE